METIFFFSIVKHFKTEPATTKYMKNHYKDRTLVHKIVLIFYSSIKSPPVSKVGKTFELKLGRKSHLLYQQYVDLIDKLDIQKRTIYSLAIHYSLSNVGRILWQN